MEIFILLSVITLVIFLVFKQVFYSAKINLFKDQATWSGKDIKIKYKKSKEIFAKKRNDNYLNIIADESKLYLENQSQQESE